MLYLKKQQRFIVARLYRFMSRTESKFLSEIATKSSGDRSVISPDNQQVLDRTSALLEPICTQSLPPVAVVNTVIAGRH